LIPKVSSVASNSFSAVSKRDTTVFANFFQVKINKSAPLLDQLYKYSIKVIPDVPDKLFKILMSQCKSKL
jgi:hypothetical protein